MLLYSYEYRECILPRHKRKRILDRCRTTYETNRDLMNTLVYTTFTVRLLKIWDKNKCNEHNNITITSNHIKRFIKVRGQPN